MGITEIIERAAAGQFSFLRTTDVYNFHILQMDCIIIGAKDNNRLSVSFPSREQIKNLTTVSHGQADYLDCFTFSLPG